MKIKMLKATNCDGKRVAKGDVVDASQKDGSFLINIGFAEAHIDKPKAKARKTKAVDSSELETR